MSKIVYYYCKTETFKSLLQSGSLWLTDLTKSNDEEEVIRTFKILWSKVKTILQQTDLDKELLEGQIERIDEAMSCQIISDIPFGCCFCDENDLVQQWNEYGGYGDGVSIGFDLEWFGIPNDYPITSTDLMQSIGYERVYYDLPGSAEQFATIFYEAIKKYGVLAWLKIILPTLKHYSGFIKNPSFKDERETRIVFYPGDKTTGELDGLSELIEAPKPHYCLAWKRKGSYALQSIMIGSSCTLSEERIIELLRNSGIKEPIPITYSDCSYRERL